MNKLCSAFLRIIPRYTSKKCIPSNIQIIARRGYFNPSLEETDRLINDEQQLFNKDLVRNQKYLLLSLFNKNNMVRKSKEIIDFLMKDEDCNKTKLFPHCKVYLDNKLISFKKNIETLNLKSFETLINEFNNFECFFDQRLPTGFDLRLLELILYSKKHKLYKESLIRVRFSKFTKDNICSILRFFSLKERKKIALCLCLDQSEISDDSPINVDQEELINHLDNDFSRNANVETKQSKSFWEIITTERFDTSQYDHEIASWMFEESRHKMHKNNQNLPMYEVYDGLKTDKLKSKFLTEYQKFNEFKEFQIENSRTFSDFGPASKKAKSSRSKQMNRFANSNSELLITLSNILEEELIILLNIFKDNAEDNSLFIENVNQVENKISSKKLFYKYAHFITASNIPINQFSLDIVYSILSIVVKKSSTEHTHIPLVKVAFEVGKVFEFSIQSDQKIREKVDLFNKVQKIEIGSSLIDIFLRACKKVNYNIIEHDYNNFSDYMVGVLRITDDEKLLPSITRSNLLNNSNFVRYYNMPMLIPPKAWSSYSKGGFYFKKNTVVLQKDYPELRQYIKESDRLGRLDIVYECLDYISSSAFAINKSVFDVFKKYFDTKKPFLGIPEAVDEDIEKVQQKAKMMEATKKKKFLEAFYNKYGLRLYFSNVVAQAEALGINGDSFYFPHAIDFRGRAYPITSGLSYMGQDCFRGLLCFWEGKKLGIEGLKWLKIQLANVYGLDKLPNSVKIARIEENIELIKDSAKDPMNGKGWWKRADKPWQTLAACFELVKALESKNPEEYKSHLPVHQDGSCNGLQHYAALGRDKEGGKEVNLIPGTRKQDLYSRVLEIVIEKMIGDSKENSAMVECILPLVERKLIKQSVMTSVYGVTRFGMVQQIRNRFDEYYEDEVKYRDLNIKENLKLTDFQLQFLKDPKNRHQSAMYITRLLVSALKDLFKNAKLIEDWLVHVSRKIINLVDPKFVLSAKTMSERIERIKKAMVTVIWTTKIGLPVVQPYRATIKKVVSTPLQKVTLNINGNYLSPINKMRQRNAIAPNFIHSLDSTHMMLTSLAAKKNNITFTSVHDSYWTHACSVPRLNVLLREEFVKLYLECDIIADLKKEFEIRYGGMYEKVYVKVDSKTGKAIKEMRDKYKNLCKGIYKSADANSIMVYELDQMSCRFTLMKPHFEILQENNDKCYYKQGNSYYEYNNKWPKTPIKLGSDVKFIPLLAPFKIPDVPSKGGLEIKNIMKSQYFFS